MPSDPTLIENGGSAPNRRGPDTAVEKTLIEPRNEGGANERTLLEGQPPPTPGGGVGLNLVPGAQFLEYRLVEPIKVASGEAELWVADGSGRRVVLKFYRWGLHPKAELSEKLRRISKAQIVDIYGSGTSPDGRDYEILEFIRHGTLADFGKGGLPETKVRGVLCELTDAVAALHAENILHRDLKPANVLVRAIEPLDLVLTDFGISSVMDISLHVTSVSRTAAYSAPEAMTGIVSKASDWWSVGVIVMELLQGAQPFAGLDERAINFALVMRGIMVPKEMPTAWQSLVKGLLTRDHAKRWNELQIRQWLEGKTNIPVYYNDASATPVVRIKQKHRPCQFLKTEYFEPGELALAMAEQWDEAAKRFQRGIIAEWIKKEVQNADMASLLMDIQEDSMLTTDQKLSVALLAMNDQLPISWRGEVVNGDWMVTHPAIGVELLKSNLPAWLKRLRRQTWLEELRDRYSKLKGKVNTACGDETILKVALSTDALLLKSGKKAQRDYYSSTDSQLNDLLSAPQLTPIEGAFLALASPTCFVRRQAVAEQHVKEFTSKIKAWGTIKFPTTRSKLNERMRDLHGAAGQLDTELKEIFGDAPMRSDLMNQAAKIINEVKVGVESLLTERISAENEVLNDLPQQLAVTNGFVAAKMTLLQIESRFSDIDCSQLRDSLHHAERTNAEAIILHDLPRQLGSGQLLTTKQSLEQVKSLFPDIECGEIERAIGEWEAFYKNPSMDVECFKTDMFKLLNMGAKNLDPSGIISLDERLTLLRTEIAERQRILNEKYEGTEFNEVAAPSIASVLDRLEQIATQLQQIKQRLEADRQRPWGGFLIVLGICGFCAPIFGVFWFESTAESSSSPDIIIVVGLVTVVGLFLLAWYAFKVGVSKLRKATSGTRSRPTMVEEQRCARANDTESGSETKESSTTGVIAALAGICFLILGVWGIHSGWKASIRIMCFLGASRAFYQFSKTQSKGKADK